QTWYESKALGLGFEFARAADAAVASALRNPFGYLRIEEEFRRVGINHPTPNPSFHRTCAKSRAGR
ncbi:MAG: hypothetical protein WCY91_01330, partial [Acidithiobacillus sp.]